MESIDAYFASTTPAQRSWDGVQRLSNGRTCVELAVECNHDINLLTIQLRVIQVLHARPVRVWHHITPSVASALVLAGAIERHLSVATAIASARVVSEDSAWCAAFTHWLGAEDFLGFTPSEQSVTMYPHLLDAWIAGSASIGEFARDVLNAHVFRVVDEPAISRLSTTPCREACDRALSEHAALRVADELLARALRSRAGVSAHAARNWLFPADNSNDSSVQNLLA